MNTGKDSRRKFIKGIAGTALAATVPGIIKASGNEKEELFKLREYYGANDNVNVALIGAGGMGTADAQTSKTVPGVKIVAACDLFDPRLEEAKKSFGADIFTTRDHKEILSRKDIDAVIIGTPDHWHKEIAVDALNAGKHVYCEKPMVHDITEGPAVIAAQNKNKVVMQVGSQGMSSLGNEKAKQLSKSIKVE